MLGQTVLHGQAWSLVLPLNRPGSLNVISGRRGILSRIRRLRPLLGHCKCFVRCGRDLDPSPVLGGVGRLGGRGRGVAGIPDPPGPEPLPLTHWSVLVKKEKMTPIDQKSQFRQFDQINPNFGFLAKMPFFLQNGSKLKILHSGFKT